MDVLDHRKLTARVAHDLTGAAVADFSSTRNARLVAVLLRPGKTPFGRDVRYHISAAAGTGSVSVRSDQ